MWHEEKYFSSFHMIFLRPFRLSLAPFICPWVSEDDLRSVSNFTASFSRRSIRQILKDCIDRSSGREKENRCLVFKSSTRRREIRYFQVVVVQRRQRNVRTSVMHMQNCCFAHLNVFWSFPFSLPSPSSGALLKLPKESGHRNRIVWKSLSRRAITNRDKNMRFQKCLDLCGHSLSAHLMFFGEF